MRIINVLLIGIGLCCTAFSCQEEEIAVAPERELPADAEIMYLTPEEEYFRAFEAIPTKGGLITEVPQQAEVSKFGYLYKPRAGFIGNDLAVLEMCASIGGSDCYDTVLVAKLGFVITNNRK